MSTAAPQPHLIPPAARMARQALLWLSAALAASAAIAANPAPPTSAHEGRLQTVGMPDDWANWRQTWQDLARRHGLQHVDTDMSSAEQIAKMEAERSQATVDLGDVGFEFGAIAQARGLTAPYKPATWSQIPIWAKDPEGHWMLAYTGTLAFAVNTRKVASSVPRSWAELFKGRYRIMIGEVGRASQANAAVLAAAVALGGDERNLQPALAAFADVARRKDLLLVNPSPALMERAEADVFLLWDFNALAFRAKLPNKADYEVFIPSDGSITSGYTTLINKQAPHPKAARLAREFILSDEGQLNLARGFARPIRIETLTLPPDLQGQLLDSRQYAKARAVRPALWTEEVKKLGRSWQREVMGGAR